MFLFLFLSLQFWEWEGREGIWYSVKFVWYIISGVVLWKGGWIVQRHGLSLVSLRCPLLSGTQEWAVYWNDRWHGNGQIMEWWNGEMAKSLKRQLGWVRVCNVGMLEFQEAALDLTWKLVYIGCWQNHPRPEKTKKIPLRVIAAHSAQAGLGIAVAPSKSQQIISTNRSLNPPLTSHSDSLNRPSTNYPNSSSLQSRDLCSLRCYPLGRWDIQPVFKCWILAYLGN